MRSYFIYVDAALATALKKSQSKVREYYFLVLLPVEFNSSRTRKYEPARRGMRR